MNKLSPDVIKLNWDEDVKPTLGVCHTFLINFSFCILQELHSDPSIRSHLSEYEMSKFEKGELTATITAMYQKNGPHLDDVLLHLRHEYDDIVEGNLHIHIGEDNCAEVFVTEGNAERVSNFIGRMRAIKGVEQVKYAVVPLS